MKTMLLIAVGLMLSACAANNKVIETVESAVEVKRQKCSKISPLLKEIGVIAIKNKLENYPDDGLCDPNLLKKQLQKKLDEANGQHES